MGTRQHTGNEPVRTRNIVNATETGGSALQRDYRWDASPNPQAVNVVADIVSADFAPGAGPHEAGELQFRLSVLAWAGGPVGEKRVWADVYVFNKAEEVIRLATFGFHYLEPVGEGDYFMLDEIVHRQPVSGRGRQAHPSQASSVRVKYRLYCRMGDELLTDGILHRSNLPARGSRRSMKS